MCIIEKRVICCVFTLVCGVFLGLSVRARAQNEQKTKKSDAEFPISFGVPTVSDKVLGRTKQESQGPIIDRCPLSLAGKFNNNHAAGFPARIPR